jgi:uncharacterized protein (TIGR00369 family)
VHDLNPVLTIEGLLQFLAESFPQIRFGDANSPLVEPVDIEIISISSKRCKVRLPFHSRNLRPGGTISGPAMFTLADVGIYLVILAHIGPVGLAVTTNMNINFLNRPEPQALLADCEILKLGKRLAIGEARLYGETDGVLVAQASGTYSIPPKPMNPR